MRTRGFGAFSPTAPGGPRDRPPPVRARAREQPTCACAATLRPPTFGGGEVTLRSLGRERLRRCLRQSPSEQFAKSGQSL